MYTVSLNNEYSDASDLFTPSLDLPKFQRNIEKNGRGCSPAVIDAVRYGRLITLWAVQEGNKPVSLSIDKFFNLTVNDCQQKTKFHLRVYGGIAGDQNFNIDTDSAKNIEQALHSLREVSKAAMETALPMEYTLKSLNNLTTNIQWKVLPYFKTYIPQVLLVFSEGVTFDVGLYANALDYQPYDNSGRMFDYVKKESTRCTLGTSWALSPKALCVEFKFDIAGGEANDFNVMLPCIPFELLEPDEKGAWTFKVHVFGPVITDAKHVDIRPNAPGTVFSKSNNFWMNKFPDSPMNVFDKAHATEKEIFEYYINWFNIRIGKKSYHYLSWLTSVKSLHDLRSYY